MAEEKKKGGGIGELLAYAGDRKWLTYLGMGLSAASQLLGFGPYVHLARGARPHCRGAQLGRGHGHRDVWVVGRGVWPGEYRGLFRGAHVHAPVCVSLRVQYP